MRKQHIFVIGAAVILSPLSVMGWGQKGHDAIAYIAQCHLTAATKHTCDSLLDGKSMVYWSNWLDNASHTDGYAYTLTWHYKNIDAGERYSEAVINPKGDIVRALNQCIVTLQDTVSGQDEKALALKMTIHLLGYIHQPMHMGRASDRGGNRHKVRFFDDETNLHSVWDSRLPSAAHSWSHTEWQREIDVLAADEQEALVKGGTPDSWGRETWRICRDVYEDTPEDTIISYDYIARWTPVIERQWLKGGLRLADLLNSIFDPEYNPQNGIVKK